MSFLESRTLFWIGYWLAVNGQLGFLVVTTNREGLCYAGISPNPSRASECMVVRGEHGFDTEIRYLVLESHVFIPRRGRCHRLISG